MPVTYKKIAALSVTTATSTNMEFTNIPATYTDLYISYSIKSDVAGGYSRINVSFNGSATGYTQSYFYGLDSSNGSGRESSTSINAIWTQATQNPGSVSIFGTGSIYVPNYTASQNKSASVDFAGSSAVTAGVVRGFLNGLWANTATITSIKLEANTGNFVQYSTAYLYGISKS
jgi:hypothetical protein